MNKIFSFALALLSFGTQAADLSVQQITADTAQQLNKTGPDAISGIGDWHLSNGVLCAVISDIDHEHEFSAKGGALVDLGFCERDDDHYTFSQDLLDGSRDKPFNGHSIRAEKSADAVSVVVKLEQGGATMEARYKLDNKHPTQLKISKRVIVSDADQADFNLISLGSFNYHSMEPFVLASQNIENSPGFANTDFVSRGISALGEAAHNADTIITLSPPDAMAPIAYGWHLNAATRVEGAERTSLPRFVLADEESTAMLVLVDDFWLGDGSRIGWLQLPQIPLLSLDEEAVLEIEETIFVSQGASIAGITDQIFPDSPEISGTANPNSAVHLILGNGAALSHRRVADDGRFSFRAPPGDYLIHHRGTAGRSVEHAISHIEGDTELGKLELPEAGLLRLPRGQAMRLVFVGLDGTPSPNFTDQLTDFSVRDDDGVHFSEPVAQVFLAGIESDLADVEIAPGNYRIYATRGLEHSVEMADVEIKAGEAKTLEIALPRREFTTPGFLAADLHVHAGNSFDNAFSNQERVRTFVAEHGELMVNSEHDVVVDFAPIIAAMGVENKITSMTGAEMTSLLPTTEMPYTGGHVNFFPYAAKPDEYRNGMVKHEGRRLRDVLHDVRSNNPGAIAQLNHPRRNLALSDGAPRNFDDLIDNGAYLDHMGAAGHPYHPGKPLHSHPNNVLTDPHPQTGLRDLDIDAIEVLNPGGQYHQQRLTAVRRDWLSFLLQGEQITGTANSDSHRGSEQVAVPRNMVAVTNDDINAFSRSEFIASLKRGNSYGTTGPMLDLDLSGAPMGSQFAGNRATLNLQVTAASWVPISRAEVQVNGITVESLNLESQREHSIELQFEQDSFVTVEVFGTANETYATLYPGLDPYAFSNPIYIDFDQDGQWQAPGLATN